MASHTALLPELCEEVTAHGRPRIKLVLRVVSFFQEQISLQTWHPVAGLHDQHPGRPVT